MPCDSGLKDTGYSFVNVDDGYFGGRKSDETLFIKECWTGQQFRSTSPIQLNIKPHGIVVLKDFVN